MQGCSLAGVAIHEEISHSVRYDTEKICAEIRHAPLAFNK